MNERHCLRIGTKKKGVSMDDKRFVKQEKVFLNYCMKGGAE
jgi:hypothetical protein